jgi:hypothetical protein
MHSGLIAGTAIHTVLALPERASLCADFYRTRQMEAVSLHDAWSTDFYGKVVRFKDYPFWAEAHGRQVNFLNFCKDGTSVYSIRGRLFEFGCGEKFRIAAEDSMRMAQRQKRLRWGDVEATLPVWLKGAVPVSRAAANLPRALRRPCVRRKSHRSISPGVNSILLQAKLGSCERSRVNRFAVRAKV